MYFSSLYRRGVRSSLTKTCCLPSKFLRSLLLERNSFCFLCETNLTMIGRGFSLFLLFCPSRCTFCISLFWRSISSSFAILNKIFSPSSLSSSFFYSVNKNIFSSYVLFLSVKLNINQICFLNHLIAWPYFFFSKLIQLIFMFNHLFLYSM